MNINIFYATIFIIGINSLSAQEREMNEAYSQLYQNLTKLYCCGDPYTVVNLPEIIESSARNCKTFFKCPGYYNKIDELENAINKFPDSHLNLIYNDRRVAGRFFLLSVFAAAGLGYLGYSNHIQGTSFLRTCLKGSCYAGSLISVLSGVGYSILFNMQTQYIYYFKNSLEKEGSRKKLKIASVCTSLREYNEVSD